MLILYMLNCSLLMCSWFQSMIILTHECRYYYTRSHTKSYVLKAQENVKQLKRTQPKLQLKMIFHTLFGDLCGK